MRLLLLLISQGLAYNFAPDYSQVFKDPYASHDSYFGYTVALRRNPPRVIVGAPRSQSRKPEYRLIKEPGVVFTFNLITGEYKELVLESAGERERADFGYADFKEKAWIGGALDVSDYSNRLTVCGSRWANQIHTDYRLMNGMCYVLADDKQTESEGAKLIPLLNETLQQFEVNSIQHFLYAYGQAGFSVHMTPKEEILFGAPGVFLWTGTVGKYDSTSNPPIVPNPHFSNIPREGYFGYVVSSGRLRTENHLYVASAPRGANYRGQVFIYSYLLPTENNATFSIHLTLEGSQIGEYFGGSLAVVDIDGDGLDDLLVGAPLHSTHRHSDAGAVYVYRNMELWNHKQPLIISGSNAQEARFGTAIGGLADFDNDGFKDVVIGAPYEDKGALYVYRGSARGLSAIYSQRITARDFEPTPLNGFGFSFSRGLDIDDNSYLDIAVGAYESGHAVVIKTKPVAKLWVRLDGNTRRMHFNASQLVLEACASYDGKFLPTNLEVAMNLTVDKIHRRAVFSSGDSTSVINVFLAKGQERCKTQILKIEPIATWSETARFAVFPISLSGSLRDSCPSCPIVDPNSNSSYFERKIQVMATCDKEECIPQWKVSADFFNVMKPFVVGSAKSVTLQVSVWNEGDNAHILQVNVHLPPEVRPRMTPSVCQLSENKLSCFTGLLIKNNRTKTFEISLDVSDIDEGVLQVNVTTHAYDSENVTQAVAILHAVRIYRLDLVGRASPPLAVVPFNVSSKQVMRVTHHYQTYCAGYSSIPNVTLEVIVPLTVRERGTWRDILNYSYSANVGEKPVTCNWMNLDSTIKRSASLAPTLSCGELGKEIKCIKIACDTGELLAGSDGMDLVLKMDVKLSVINLFLRKAAGIYFNTSAIAYSSGTGLTPISKGIATFLAGPVPDKEDPWFYWYIAFAVLVALGVLLLIVLICWKWGFFKRTELPIETDEDVVLYSLHGENKED